MKLNKESGVFFYTRDLPPEGPVLAIGLMVMDVTMDDSATWSHEVRFRIVRQESDGQIVIRWPKDSGYRSSSPVRRDCASVEAYLVDRYLSWCDSAR